MSSTVAPASVGALARASRLSLALSMIRASAAVRTSREPKTGARLMPVRVSLFHTPVKSGLPLKRGGEKPGAIRGPRIGTGASTSCSEPDAPSTALVPGRTLSSWAGAGPAASKAPAAINRAVKRSDAMCRFLPTALSRAIHAVGPTGTGE